jgi:hypothetical protein
VIHTGTIITIIVMAGTDMMIDGTTDGEMTTDVVTTTDVGTTATTTAPVSGWIEAAAETETLPLTRMVGIDDKTTAAEIIDE